jgi:hypothetical protein
LANFIKQGCVAAGYGKSGWVGERHILKPLSRPFEVWVMYETKIPPYGARTAGLGTPAG